MSGNYNKRDGFVYLFRNGEEIDPFHVAMIETMFDEQVQYDSEEIKLDIEENKLFRKVCLVKTLLFPLEIVITKLAMGEPWTEEKIKAQKIYWKFLCKKITLTELKESITKLVGMV